MDPAVTLLGIHQGERSLEDHIQTFLDYAHFSKYPDCILIDIFCDTLNAHHSSIISRCGPRGSFAEFMDYALSAVGSLFTVGEAEVEASP